MKKPDPIRIATIKGLTEGLGVEDIAVRSGFPVERVRFCVRVLRGTGALAEIIEQARNGGAG